MDNKILIILTIPFTDDEYDLFIPINKKVGTIKKIIIDSISNFNHDYNHILINKNDNKIIKENVYVKNSGITNGTRIILI